MGLLASTNAPTGDLYRSYLLYDVFQEWPSSVLIPVIKHSLDFTLLFLIYFFAKLNIGMQLLVFLVVSFVSGSILYAYFQVAKTNSKYFESRNLLLLGALVPIFLIDFFAYGLKLRAPLGQLLIFLFFYNIIFKAKTKYWILIVGVLSHFSSVLVAPIVVMNKKMTSKQAKRFLAISLVVMFFLLDGFILLYDLLQPILTYFPVLNRRISFYIVGKWGGGYLDSFSLNALIRHYWGVSLYFIVMGLYLLKTREHNRTLLIYFGFVNLLFCFPNTFNRFYLVPIFLSFFLLIRDFGINYKKNISFVIILVTLLAVTGGGSLINIMAQRRPLSISNVSDVFYKNAFQVLNHRYDKEWVKRKVNKKGLIIGDENETR